MITPRLTLAFSLLLALAGCAGSAPSASPAPAAPVAAAPAAPKIERTVEPPSMRLDLGVWYPAGSGLAPEKITLDYAVVWPVAGMPPVGSRLKLHAIDCIRDESGHQGTSRCGPRGSVGLEDDRFRAVSLERAQQCYDIVDEPPPDSLVAWAKGISWDVPKASEDELVLVRTLSRTHSETVSAKGCENYRGACDPFPVYTMGPETSERPTTSLLTPASDAERAALRIMQPSLPTTAFWAPDTSLVFAATIARWIQPTIQPEHGPSVSDPRFRMAPAGPVEFDAYARAWRSKLEAIDGSKESRDVRAALAVDLSVIALALEDRAMLAPVGARLEAVAKEFDAASSEAFGRREVEQMRMLVAGVRAGEIETHDPCSVPHAR